jgi:ectoine hydroxylase-related dioxygenase (phytanoyl-CoA dioxygenase family)
MNDHFNSKGFVHHKAFFDEEELAAVRHILLSFHGEWQNKHADYYNEKAINSAYITHKESLHETERQTLFQFIASDKIMALVNSVFDTPPMFMNTQLFFNPVNAGQKNYWHRDPQYHLSVDEQKAALSGPQVVHFRIPLFDELGLELIPETHKRWDTPQEQAVRLEEGGHKHFEDLDTGLSIQLCAGDLLIFSANMIHRGLYGQDRLALDVLFCERDPSLITFIDKSCLPSQVMLETLDNPVSFIL